MKRSYIILIGAVLIALVVWLVERPDRPEINDFEPFRLYPEISGDNVERIEIEHLISGARLVKKSDGWKVAEIKTDLGKKAEEQDKKEGVNVEKVGEITQEFRVDAKEIDRVLDTLGRVEAQSLASNNPEKQLTYQVGNIAKKVRLYDSSGKIIASLYIGKRGPDMFSTYVRREGEDEVYLTNEQIGALLPADVMSWRDKNIWDIDSDFISGIQVKKRAKKGEEFYSLSKGADGTWQVAEPSGALLDTAKVEKFVNTISNIKAARFAHETEDKNTGLSKPSLEVEVTTNDGTVHKLFLGNESDQGYVYAGASGVDEIYLLGSEFQSKIPGSWMELMPDAENISE